MAERTRPTPTKTVQYPITNNTAPFRKPHTTTQLHRPNPQIQTSIQAPQPAPLARKAHPTPLKLKPRKQYDLRERDQVPLIAANQSTSDIFIKLAKSEAIKPVRTVREAPKRMGWAGVQDPEFQSTHHKRSLLATYRNSKQTEKRPSNNKTHRFSQVDLKFYPFKNFRLNAVIEKSYHVAKVGHFAILLPWNYAARTPAPRSVPFDQNTPQQQTRCLDMRS